MSERRLTAGDDGEGQPGGDSGQSAATPLRPAQCGGTSAEGGERGEGGDGQQAAPLQPGRQHGHDRRADGIGEGKPSDQMTGGGQPDVEVNPM